jgi:glucose-6-phosphate dehydrogenase assembly protein OpcA
MDGFRQGDRIFTAGEALTVDSQRIEEALRQLWADQRRRNQGVVRACMGNLVVVAGPPEQAEAATEAIGVAAATHLVRAIVLTDAPSTDGRPLKAWISAHCQAPRGGAQRVCCEQVTIAATEEAQELLPSAVLPLLVPDMPVLLWWMDEPPFGAPIFEQLIVAADRLIVDTMRFEDPTFSLTRLAALVRDQAGRIAVGDLNWGRLTAWQDQVAQLFDSLDTLPLLDRLDRVSVRYLRPSSGRVDPEKALLLAGWLLNRIGWKQPPALPRVGTGHYRGRLRRAGREVAVEIAPWTSETPDDAPDNSGLLMSIELRASLGARSATFRVSRRAGELDTIETVINLDGGDPLHGIRVRPRRALASLLAEELGRADHDFLYEASLETAAHLTGAAQLLR